MTSHSRSVSVSVVNISLSSALQSEQHADEVIVRKDRVLNKKDLLLNSSYYNSIHKPHSTGVLNDLCTVQV